MCLRSVLPGPSPEVGMLSFISYGDTVYRCRDASLVVVHREV